MMNEPIKLDGSMMLWLVVIQLSDETASTGKTSFHFISWIGLKFDISCMHTELGLKIRKRESLTIIHLSNLSLHVSADTDVCRIPFSYIFTNSSLLLKSSAFKPKIEILF